MNDEIQNSNLPDGWVWTTIGEIAILSSGGTPDREIQDYFNGNIPQVKSGELNYNIIADTEEKITDIALCNSSAKLIPSGALLVALYGNTVGKLAFLGVDAATNQAVASIITTSSFEKKYLFYYLINNREKLLQKRIGAAQPNISQRILSNFPLPLSSLEEQRAIILLIESLFSKLKEAEVGLKNAEKKLEIYKQALLKKAFEGKLTEQWRKDNNIESAKILLNNIESERQYIYMSELQKWNRAIKQWEIDKTISVRPSKPNKPIIPNKPDDNQLSKKWELPENWEWTQLGLITFVTKLAGFEYTKSVRYNASGDLSVIKAENIGKNGFKKTEYSKIVSETVSHLKRTQLRGGELIIVFVGSGIGNVAIVPENCTFFLGPNIAMVRPYVGVNNK